jgi:hypothetical protein
MPCATSSLTLMHVAGLVDGHAIHVIDALADLIALEAMH